MSARVERIRTDGIFRLDGEELEVTNNVWLFGDDNEVIVIDPAHDAEAIAAAIGDRRVVAIVATHGHNDHINGGLELARTLRAPVGIHPDDRMLWDAIYPERNPDVPVEDGDTFFVAHTQLRTLHTPGHTPGSVCFYDGVENLFSGDTLFPGGPGATHRRHGDFGTIITSIRERLGVLPPETFVRPGHGDDTVLGDELPHLNEWTPSSG